MGSSCVAESMIARADRRLPSGSKEDVVQAPSEEELAGARVFVQREGVQVPIAAEWHALVDGRVLVRFRESGGWEVSMFDLAALTAAGADWVEQQRV
jgi:hypothetical protein